MKIGILGGGQLGKMLYVPAIQMDLDITFMDSVSDGPVARITDSYEVGQIQQASDVLAFGANKDVLSIEIEKVSTEALQELEKKGKKVFPQPQIIQTIQDKGLQKQFYTEHHLPTSRYALCTDRQELKQHLQSDQWDYPAVLKLRKDGYDGRGVQILKNAGDVLYSFEQPTVLEEKVKIKKEISVVTCRDQQGHVVAYDPVEMVFHPEQNILLYQLAPADIPQDIWRTSIYLAMRTAEAYGIVGLLAIEMFWTDDDEVLINEVAPRPHNSGHHTIEACYTSQYENHLRAISGLPLGSTKMTTPSLLMNVLGDEGHTGSVCYDGLEDILAIEGVNVHLYGKPITKPFRKMGHITILGEDVDTLVQRYEQINRTLRVISKT